MRPGSFTDRFAMMLILIGVAAHPLWLGHMLSYFLSFRLGYLPLSGYCELSPRRTSAAARAHGPTTCSFRG